MSVPAPAELDVAVTGGLVVTGGSERHLDVGIRDGRIAALAEPGTLAPAREQVPAAGLIVLPGGIDTHTHIRWPIPGAPDSLDDFRTGTMAAAAGGTTTVIDFVPQPQGRSHWAAANDRLDEASGRAVVDFSFHPILTAADPATLADIRRLIDAGMGSFKVYTTSEQPLDDGEIRSLTIAIAEGGGLAGFHAENHGIIQRSRHDVGRRYEYATSAFPQSRPAAAESESIAMVTHFARELAAPVYIYHVSSTAALRAISAARTLGTAVFAETCTHYLTFDDSVYQRDDAWTSVITPPIRDHAAGRARDQRPAAVRLGPRGRRGPDRGGRVRRADRDQRRPHPRPLPPQGSHRGRLGCRPGAVRPDPGLGVAGARDRPG
jgi:dihydropyrimidinase